MATKSKDIKTLYGPPRPSEQMFDDDTNGCDKAVTFHICRSDNTYVHIETHFNCEDEGWPDECIASLPKEVTYVKAIDVIVTKGSLSREVLMAVEWFCPVLKSSERIGDAVRYEFVHPIFYPSLP